MPPQASAGQLDADQIDELLRAEYIARIACHASGRTYVVPVLYAYDGDYVYGHASEGMKLRLMRANPEVCFDVERIESLTDWRTVIGWGRFEELHGDAANHAEQLLVERVMRLLPATPKARSGDHPAPRRAVVYRIALVERSGRYERR
jgi:uncharacterized protein